MAILVTAVGVMAAIVGVVIAAAPERFADFIASRDPRARYWTAVLRRVAVGFVFLLAAPDCRVPEVVRFLGVLALFGAAIVFFLGAGRLDSFVARWTSRPSNSLRPWSLVPFGMGALLIYSGA